MQKEVQKETEVIIQSAMLASKITKALDGQLSIHGISFSEYLILYHLSQAPGQVLPRITLAELTCLSASGITRLIRPMIKIGLVEKQANPRDARQSLVALSTAGRRIYDETTVSVDNYSKKRVSLLNKEQLEVFTQLSQGLF